MKAVAVDDDELSLSIIDRLTSLEPDVEMVALLYNGTEALRYLSVNDVDLLFLDVELPDMTGLQLLDILRQPPLVVLTTGKAEYAVESYRYNVVDYLLKPIQPLRFTQAMLKVHEAMGQQNKSTNAHSQFIFVKVDGQYQRIDTRDIRFLEASRNNTLIHTRQGVITVATKISSLAKVLTGSEFMRVHRSYLVNLSAIELLQGAVAVIGNKPIPISRDQQESLEQRLNIVH